MEADYSESEAASVIQRSLRVWLARSQRQRLEAVKSSQMEELFRSEEEEYRDSCAKVVQQVFTLRKSSKKFLSCIMRKRVTDILSDGSNSDGEPDSPDYISRLYYSDRDLKSEMSVGYPAFLYDN